jgi:AraC-like DNA-binding protein
LPTSLDLFADGPGHDQCVPPRPRVPERFRVTSRSAGLGMDAWVEALDQTHVAFDVGASRRAGDGPFEGSIVRHRFADLELVDCAASPWAGRRNAALVASRPRDCVGFQVLRKGVELVDVGKLHVQLTPGDLILWDGCEPVDVEVPEPFVKRTLIVPRERVLAACPRLAELDQVPMLRPTAGARLLARYLDALALELPTLDAAQDVAAADVAVELLRAAIEPSVPTTRSARRSEMRERVRRHIRSHLQDPELGPESIARAHALSVRALHALFEGTGESVAGLVRSQRLARCMEDLRQPSAGSVTEIAFRWGFSDAAHFSRVFKRAFGMTPSHVRRSALEGEPAAAPA